MSKIITYSLRADDTASDCYYIAIADLADQWMPDATRVMSDIVTDFKAYRRANGQVERTDAEHVYELLVLGVMLREHGGEANQLPRSIAWLMRRMIALSGRYPRLEPTFKWLRGWLGWLGRRGEYDIRRHGRDTTRLLEWMRAYGQAARADHLEEWQNYLQQKSRPSAQVTLARVQTFTDEFDRLSRRVLGRYTTGVEWFRAHTANQYAHRYDAEMVSRTLLEYHMGMLGTEVLNRANRERFLATKRRVVILPPCMRAQPDEQCQAIATPLGAKCQHCTANCQAHQITLMGEQRGFDVFMIPDQMARVSTEAGKSAGGIGLVGVSCALTNWSGGWDTDALGLPAQGVLLDYVGCKYHWDEKGIPTAVNAKQLADVATAGLAR